MENIKVISKTEVSLLIKAEDREILIPIEKREISGKIQDTVLASDLQGRVKPSSLNHNTWANRHIKKLGFVDGEDYMRLVFKSEKQISGAKNMKDLVFSFNSAREIMIVEDRTIRREVLKAYDQLQEITKNGFYISKEISDNQVLDLMEESLSIYENRKLFDLELRKLKSEIYGELLNQGATKKQVGGIFANMFQNLHIATTKRTAGQIVFDEMKIQSLLNLKNLKKELKNRKIFQKKSLFLENIQEL